MFHICLASLYGNEDKLEKKGTKELEDLSEQILDCEGHYFCTKKCAELYGTICAILTIRNLKEGLMEEGI